MRLSQCTLSHEQLDSLESITDLPADNKIELLVDICACVLRQYLVLRTTLGVFGEMSSLSAARAEEIIRNKATIIQSDTEWKVDTIQLTDSGIARFTRTLTGLQREEKQFVSEFLASAQFARRSENEYQESFLCGGDRVRAARISVKAKREGYVECAYSVLELKKKDGLLNLGLLNFGGLWNFGGLLNFVEEILGCDTDLPTLRRNAEVVVNARLARMIEQQSV